MMSGVRPLVALQSKNNYMCQSFKAQSKHAQLKEILFNGSCSKKSLKIKLWYALSALPFIGWFGGAGYAISDAVNKHQQIHIQYTNQLDDLHHQNPVLCPQSQNVANSKSMLLNAKLDQTDESAHAALQHFHNMSQAAQRYLNSEEYQANDNKEQGLSLPLALSQVSVLQPLSPAQALLTQQFYWDLQTGEKNSGEAFAAWLKEVNPQQLSADVISQAEKEIHIFQNRLIQWRDNLNRLEEEKIQAYEENDLPQIMKITGSIIAFPVAFVLFILAFTNAARLKEEENIHLK
jgi:hypothetical protein